MLNNCHEKAVRLIRGSPITDLTVSDYFIILHNNILYCTESVPGTETNSQDGAGSPEKKIQMQYGQCVVGSRHFMRKPQLLVAFPVFRPFFFHFEESIFSKFRSGWSETGSGCVCSSRGVFFFFAKYIMANNTSDTGMSLTHTALPASA